MITSEFVDVLFPVAVLPTYAVYEIGKKTTRYFAGYATVNLDEGKVLQQVSDRYKLRTNEMAIGLVKTLYPTYTPRFAYYRNNKAYFHIIGTLNEVKDGVQLGIEIVNSYDTNTATRAYLVYKVIAVNSYYIYTDVDLEILFDEADDEWETQSPKNLRSMLEKDLCVYLDTPVKPDREQYSWQWVQLPNRVKKYMSDKLVPEMTRWDMLKYSAIGIDISGWYNKSFEQARNWLANLYQKG